MKNLHGTAAEQGRGGGPCRPCPRPPCRASRLTRRQEFDSDRCPDLQKDVYLQDIHCVSSLCKAYFRELPNPLLTYQLYDKFAVSVPLPGAATHPQPREVALVTPSLSPGRMQWLSRWKRLAW